MHTKYIQNLYLYVKYGAIGVKDFHVQPLKNIKGVFICQNLL